MAGKEKDPNLNLLSFNDHGIFTLEEPNQLFPVVKQSLFIWILEA